jgi:hypothetical protein
MPGSMRSAVSVLGFVPNLVGMMASSPAPAEACLTLSGILERNTSLR